MYMLVVRAAIGPRHSCASLARPLFHREPRTRPTLADGCERWLEPQLRTPEPGTA